jgi:hypothetical protein
MTTYNIKEAERVNKRLYLDMGTVAQLLNHLEKLEVDFKEDEEFYRNIRKFIHHRVVTNNQYLRYEKMREAINHWKSDARLNVYPDERERFRELLKLVEQFIQVKDEPTDISTLIIYDHKKKEYKLCFNQW